MRFQQRRKKQRILKRFTYRYFGNIDYLYILYVVVALVLTGMMPYSQIDFQAPIAHAMRVVGQDRFAGFISVGALAGLTSVLLIYQLGTTRILYAMSRDGFLPKAMRRINRKHRTPEFLTWVAGLVVIVGSLFMDLNISAELCNFGTFTSFIIVCIAVLILRKTDLTDTDLLGCLFHPFPDTWDINMRRVDDLFNGKFKNFFNLISFVAFDRFCYLRYLQLQKTERIGS